MEGGVSDKVYGANRSMIDIIFDLFNMESTDEGREENINHFPAVNKSNNAISEG